MKRNDRFIMKKGEVKFIKKKNEDRLKESSYEKGVTRIIKRQK